MDKYAAAHPGRMGDALYSLPLLRYLYGCNGWKFDFFTSEYCLPLKELFEYQPYINSFQISKEYVLDNWGCGGQPYHVPIPNESEYNQIFQLGFRGIPDRALHQYIALQAGYTIALGISYEYPRHSNILGDYICIAPRGETSYKQLFNDLADKTSAVIIGGIGEYTGHGIDMTGKTMLETLSLLSHAQGFVGLMSSQLVLANGFPYPKIGINGYQSDMRHAVITASNFYPPKGSTVEDIKRILGV